MGYERSCRSSNPGSSEVFLHAYAAKDLISLLDALDLKKVKTIGYSSGGIVILEVAVSHPERFEVIIPIRAQINFGPEMRKFIEENAKPEEYYKFNDLENLHGKQKGQILAHQFYHFHKLPGDPAITTEQLNKITAKTLIIHGDNDFVPYSQALAMYESIPNAHLWIVPNGWHLPHMDANADWFMEIALRFLKTE